MQHKPTLASINLKHKSTLITFESVLLSSILTLFVMLIITGKHISITGTGNMLIALGPTLTSNISQHKPTLIFSMFVVNIENAFHHKQLSPCFIFHPVSHMKQSGKSVEEKSNQKRKFIVKLCRFLFRFVKDII